jgi:hypothetical protein
MRLSRIEQVLVLLATSVTLLGVSSCTAPAPLANVEQPVATSPKSAVILQPGTQIVFADVEQGKQRLTTRDMFIETVSPFDRAARLKTDRDVSVDEFVEFIAQQVRPWTNDDKTRITAAVESLAQKFARLKLNLPQMIPLIKTTGDEEGGATYTRAGAIVIPQKQLDRRNANIENLLIHELFHVLTSHNPQLKEALYQIISFKKCNNIELPASLHKIRITNPDGPLNDRYVELQHNLQTTPVVPVIYSSAEKYDTEKGGPFFRYITFRLLAIEHSNGQWLYKKAPDGEPILLEPKNVPDYFAKIGANTNYVIHPEEILAENFVLLVNNTQNLRSKWVIDKMNTLLTEK